MIQQVKPDGVIIASPSRHQNSRGRRRLMKLEEKARMAGWGASFRPGFRIRKSTTGSPFVRVGRILFQPLKWTVFLTLCGVRHQQIEMIKRHNQGGQTVKKQEATPDGAASR